MREGGAILAAALPESSERLPEGASLSVSARYDQLDQLGRLPAMAA